RPPWARSSGTSSGFRGRAVAWSSPTTRGSCGCSRSRASIERSRLSVRSRRGSTALSVGSRELRPGLQVVSSQPAGGVEDAIGRLQDLVATVLDENDQLRRALESRIVIEQAKGVLAERYGIDVQTAFEVLRGSARSNRMSIHALAEAGVASPE